VFAVINTDGRTRHNRSSTTAEVAVSTPTVDPQALAAEIAGLIGRQTTPPLLDAEQAGQLLNVPASWMLAQARMGRVPHVRLGHYVRFNRDDLLAWIDHRSSGLGGRRERA
jgi:excisionase family DNA binding protein